MLFQHFLTLPLLKSYLRTFWCYQPSVVSLWYDTHSPHIHLVATTPTRIWEQETAQANPSPGWCSSSGSTTFLYSFKISSGFLLALFSVALNAYCSMDLWSSGMDLYFFQSCELPRDLDLGAAQKYNQHVNSHCQFCVIINCCLSTSCLWLEHLTHTILTHPCPWSMGLCCAQSQFSQALLKGLIKQELAFNQNLLKESWPAQWMTHWVGLYMPALAACLWMKTKERNEKNRIVEELASHITCLANCVQFIFSQVM